MARRRCSRLPATERGKGGTGDLPRGRHRSKGGATKHGRADWGRAVVLGGRHLHDLVKHRRVPAANVVAGEAGGEARARREERRDGGDCKEGASRFLLPWATGEPPHPSVDQTDFVGRPPHATCPRRTRPTSLCVLGRRTSPPSCINSRSRAEHAVIRRSSGLGDGGRAGGGEGDLEAVCHAGAGDSTRATASSSRAYAGSASSSRSTHAAASSSSAPPAAPPPPPAVSPPRLCPLALRAVARAPAVIGGREGGGEEEAIGERGEAAIGWKFSRAC